MLKLLKYSILNILLTIVFMILLLGIYEVAAVFGLFLKVADPLVSLGISLFFTGFLIAREKVVEITWKKYLWFGACFFAGIALPLLCAGIIWRSMPGFRDGLVTGCCTGCGICGVFVRDKLLPKRKYIAYGVIFLFSALFFLPFFLSLNHKKSSYREGGFSYGGFLIEAIKADDFEEVKKRVTLENVNYVDETGATPIMWAAYYGNEGIVNFLIKKGADVREKGYITVEHDSGFLVFTSPLDAAAAKGHLEVVEYLIEKAGFLPDDNPGCVGNLFIEEEDIENYDRIIEVMKNEAECKCSKILGKLDSLTNGEYSESQQKASFVLATNMMLWRADLVNEKPDKFMLRKVANNRKKIDEVFKGGLRKAKSYEFFIGENGETPLITAVREGHTRVVSYLISKGADVNYKDCHGNTPLSVAREEKRQNLVEMLIKNGAVE